MTKQVLLRPNDKPVSAVLCFAENKKRNIGFRHYRPGEVFAVGLLKVEENGQIVTLAKLIANYCTMRIPESVVVRVHKRLTGGPR
jgi:hypothetical protein